jgi:hypothetical protein
VAGPARDFCLVVVQRRHLDDTDLGYSGPHAREWLLIAQAFAGQAGAGRQPGQFSRAGRTLPTPAHCIRQRTARLGGRRVLAQSFERSGWDAIAREWARDLFAL